jgi:hypothetical protein
MAFSKETAGAGDEEMNMIGHDHEFMEQKAALLAILMHRVN